MKQMWDARYSEEDYAYGEEPNRFFAESLGAAPKPGASRILLPADGEGRNAVHAAREGWVVDAYDISEAGRDKAQRLAERERVEISYAIAGHETAEIEPGSYDAVALIFAHMPPQLRRAMHRRLAAALAPGGRLLLEAYSKQQLEHGTGGPPVEPMLYSLEELREDFAELEIETLEQIETEIVEGKYHTGLASVIRLVARRRG
jgi:hypothetical protein